MVGSPSRIMTSEGRNRACLEQPTVSHVSAEEKGLLFGHSQFQDIE